jgi:O-antigen ligase
MNRSVRAGNGGLRDSSAPFPKVCELAIRTISISLVVFYLVKADIFLYLQGSLPIAPATLFVVASVPLLFIVLLGIVHENRYVSVFHRCRWVVLPFVFIVAVSLVGVFQRNTSQIERQLFFPLLDFYVFLVGITLAGLVNSKRLWRIGAFIGLVITVGTIFLDVIHPYTFTLPELVGPAGLAQNPNGGAYVALLLTVATLDWEKQNVSWIDGLIIVVALAAIFATGSRSGIISSIAIMLFYFYRARKCIRLQSLLSIGVLGVLGITLVGPRIYNNAAIFSVLSFTSSRIAQLLGSGSESAVLTDTSVMERLQAIHQSADLISQHPLLGVGTGVSYEMPVGPHNMYLARLVDNGLIGLMVYLWFLAAAVAVNLRKRNFEGVAIALAIVLLGLFSHNVLEDRTALLLLGISTATVAGERSRGSVAGTGSVSELPSGLDGV